MNLEARISGIRDLLINGDLSEAIATTSELVDEIGQDSFNYSVYLIHEQYNQLIRENVEGNLSRESMLLERNKITLSVLQLLQVIQYQKSEGKRKTFFYAQAAIAALSLLLIISIAYIFLNRNGSSDQQSIAAVEKNENARATIVNSHPEDILYENDTTIRDISINTPTNESYFDAIPEEVNYQENIFDMSEDEFGITLRFVENTKNIDELVEAPVKISVSRLKNKIIRHFDLKKSDFSDAGSNAKWYLFANDKKITKENRNLEGAGLFDYDLVTIKYIGEEESTETITEDAEEQTTTELEDYSTDDQSSLIAEETRLTSTEESPIKEQDNTIPTATEELPVFEPQEINRSIRRPPARTVDGPPQLPEIEEEPTPTNDEPKQLEDTNSSSTTQEEKKVIVAEDKPKKEKENKKDRKKDTSRDGQTFSYLIFIPGETSVHLRQSSEVFNTKTNNYYTRNSFTQEDFDLLTNRKLLIRDRDGQKLYTTLRSSSNQYFVAVEGGVGASEEDFYTITINGKKMAAVPISSKEYDRLLKIANTAFKGPRVDNVSVKGNGSDFTKRSIILAKK